jgi:hypothetical protein
MLGPETGNGVDFEPYKTSLSQEAPPEGLSMTAQALGGCLDRLSRTT